MFALPGGLCISTTTAWATVCMAMYCVAHLSGCGREERRVSVVVCQAERQVGPDGSGTVDQPSFQLRCRRVRVIVQPATPNCP